MSIFMDDTLASDISEETKEIKAIADKLADFYMGNPCFTKREYEMLENIHYKLSMFWVNRAYRDRCEASSKAA